MLLLQSKKIIIHFDCNTIPNKESICICHDIIGSAKLSSRSDISNPEVTDKHLFIAFSIPLREPDNNIFFAQLPQVLHRIICCGYLLESLWRGDSNRSSQHVTLRRNYHFLSF